MNSEHVVAQEGTLRARNIRCGVARNNGRTNVAHNAPNEIVVTAHMLAHVRKRASKSLHYAMTRTGKYDMLKYVGAR